MPPMVSDTEGGAAIVDPSPDLYFQTHSVQTSLWTSLPYLDVCVLSAIPCRCCGIVCRPIVRVDSYTE